MQTTDQFQNRLKLSLQREVTRSIRITNYATKTHTSIATQAMVLVNNYHIYHRDIVFQSTVRRLAKHTAHISILKRVNQKPTTNFGVICDSLIEQNAIRRLIASPRCQGAAMHLCVLVGRAHRSLNPSSSIALTDFVSIIRTRINLNELEWLTNNLLESRTRSPM